MSEYLISRRRSVAQANEAFMGRMETTIGELHTLWDEAGMYDDCRGDRVSTFYKHLDDLRQDMLISERTMVDELRKSAHDYAAAIRLLCEQLTLEQSPALIAAESMELIERVEALRAEKKRLNALKKERRAKWTIMRDRDNKLCARLATTAFPCPDDDDQRAPSDADLEDLERHVTVLETLLQIRAADFDDARVEMQRLLTRMGRTRSSDPFIVQVLAGEQHFLFSHENMETLKLLLDELRQQYNDYLAAFRTRFDALQLEADEWRRKCLLTDDQYQLPPFDEDSISEALIEKYEKEISRLQAYFSEREEVLSKVNTWKTLWTEKIEHDRRQNDPARYHNRGGNLDRELKRKRLVERVLLPQATNAVREATQRWQMTHANDPILIEQCDPCAFIELTMREYVETCDLEKEQKHAQKRRLLMVESQYGAAFSSPSRRPIAQSSMFKSPLKSPMKAPLTPQNVQSPLSKRPKLTPAIIQPIGDSVISYNNFAVGIHGKVTSDGSNNPVHSSFVSQRPGSPKKMPK